MTNSFKPPTHEELEAIIAGIHEQFPYVASPSSNPGKGNNIFNWMEENFGPLDSSWTVIDRGTVRFRTEEDKAAFILAWNSDWENTGWGVVDEDPTRL